MRNYKLKQVVNGGDLREGDNCLLVLKDPDGTHHYYASNDTGAWNELSVELSDEVVVDPDPVDPVDPDPIPAPNPVANIQNAAQLSAALAVGAGDYVLAGGDYGNMPTIPPLTTIRAADPANRPKFTGLNINGGADIALENLHFKYDYTAGDPDHITLCYVTGTTRLSMIGCLIEGDTDPSGVIKGRGLNIWAGNSDIILDDCEFHTWWKALSFQGDGLIVRGCDFHSIRSDGLNTKTADNVLIEGCYFHDFGSAGGGADHRDMIQFMGINNGVVVRNNFFDINQGKFAQVIWADGNTPMDAVLIEDNVIIASHTNCIAMHNVGAADVLDNVIVWHPRAEPNIGVQTPKINMPSGQVTVTGNTVPGITAPTGVDALNTIQDGDPDATRAAARADPRWAHFFGG